MDEEKSNSSFNVVFFSQFEPDGEDDMALCTEVPYRYEKKSVSSGTQTQDLQSR